MSSTGLVVCVGLALSLARASDAFCTWCAVSGQMRYGVGAGARACCSGRGARQRVGPCVVQPAPRRGGTVLRMVAAEGDPGNVGDERLREAEAALDAAIAGNDVNEMNKWMKAIEKLQAAGGGRAGSAPLKKMSKEEEAAEIRALLGIIDDAAAGAANAEADAPEGAALDGMDVALRAAEAALDEAVAAGDAPAIARATRHLESLVPKSSFPEKLPEAPGPDVQRDLAASLEEAALDAGEDADDVGLLGGLEELSAADMATRVEAARAIIEESVADNDARALANAVSVLGRLLGPGATSEALREEKLVNVDLADFERALRSAGVANLASSEAAADIADALVAALAGRDDVGGAGSALGDADLNMLVEDGDYSVGGDGLLERACDKSAMRAAAGAYLDEAVAAGDVAAVQEAVLALRELPDVGDVGDGNGGAVAGGEPGAEMAEASVRLVTGREVPGDEVAAVADALAAAEQEMTDNWRPDSDLLEGVGDLSLRTSVAQMELDEAVEAAGSQVSGGGGRGVDGVGSASFSLASFLCFVSVTRALTHAKPVHSTKTRVC